MHCDTIVILLYYTIPTTLVFPPPPSSYPKSLSFSCLYLFLFSSLQSRCARTHVYDSSGIFSRMLSIHLGLEGVRCMYSMHDCIVNFSCPFILACIGLHSRCNVTHDSRVLFLIERGLRRSSTFGGIKLIYMDFSGKQLPLLL